MAHPSQVGCVLNYNAWDEDWEAGNFRGGTATTLGGFSESARFREREKWGLARLQPNTRHITF